jgi:hypothetical protein
MGFTNQLIIITGGHEIKQLFKQMQGTSEISHLMPSVYPAKDSVVG